MRRAFARTARDAEHATRGSMWTALVVRGDPWSRVPAANHAGVCTPTGTRTTAALAGSTRAIEVADRPNPTQSEPARTPSPAGYGPTSRRLSTRSAPRLDARRGGRRPRRRPDVPARHDHVERLAAHRDATYAEPHRVHAAPRPACGSSSAHTKPAPAATGRRRDRAHSPRHRFVLGFTRRACRSPSFATQTAPNPRGDAARISPVGSAPRVSGRARATSAQQEREKHLAEHLRRMASSRRAAGLPRRRPRARASDRRPAAPHADVLARRRSPADRRAVRLKAELFQRTGSFKPRGVLNKLASLTDEEKERGVIAISAGNHAQALAYCAALEGIDALVVMWQGASPQKIAATRAYGADGRPRGADDPGRGVRAARRADRGDRPHARPSVRRPARDRRPGHGRARDARGRPRADVVLVPVGGGGLVSGIATAVEGLTERASSPSSPSCSDALHAGLEAGESVRVEPRSIADGLNAPFAGEHCARDLPRARRRDRARLARTRSTRPSASSTAAPSSPASPPARPRAAALLAGKVDARARHDTVVAVVSGGNVAPQTASAILASNDEGRHPSRVRPRDRPLLLRQRVPDALDEARAARRDLLDCHPFYTGKQKLIDTGGRVERFQRRLEKAGGARKRLAPRRVQWRPIGGQAVLEGVMMRGPSTWAVAVRKPDGEIAQVNQPIDSPMARHWSAACRSSAASSRSASRSRSASARSRSRRTTRRRRRARRTRSRDRALARRSSSSPSRSRSASRSCSSRSRRR